MRAKGSCHRAIREVLQSLCASFCLANASSRDPPMLLGSAVEDIGGLHLRAVICDMDVAACKHAERLLS